MPTGFLFDLLPGVPAEAGIAAGGPSALGLVRSSSKTALLQALATAPTVDIDGWANAMMAMGVDPAILVQAHAAAAGDLFTGLDLRQFALTLFDLGIDPDIALSTFRQAQGG